mmetsp:Transcript_33940/g.66767  ORF Transcript_33940/g.66767 Transcript_33940/m.66767 type:complete len:372 (-) Transcript_33940:434-1549(-)
MKCTGVHLLIPELFVQPLCCILRIDKHKRSSALRAPCEEVVEDCYQLVVLVLWAHLFKVLLHSVDSPSHDADANPNIVVEKVLCHFLALIWEGCGEHHGLPALFLGHAVILHDCTHLWLKTHIKHAVSLIKYQNSHFLDRDYASIEEVLQAAWSSHHYVGSLANFLKLHLCTLTAVDPCSSEFCPVGELKGLIVDLQAKLACGSDDQNIWSAHPLERGSELTNGVFIVHHHSADKWHKEGRSLAATGLRTTHDVPARQADRDRVLLHWRWCLILTLPNVIHQCLWYDLRKLGVQFLECFANGNQVGLVPTHVDGHGLVCSEVEPRGGALVDKQVGSLLLQLPFVLAEHDAILLVVFLRVPIVMNGRLFLTI